MIDLTVWDGFATDAEVSAALAAWPADGWHEYASGKRVSRPETMLPAPIAELVHRMATLPGLGLPDLSLWGAGLHEIPPGRGLGWHTDAERHPHLGFARRRSGVLYLCGDGYIGFRDGVWVTPRPGRLVVFNGSASHRVGPVTHVRRSVSLFWYDRPAKEGRTRAEFEGSACH